MAEKTREIEWHPVRVKVEGSYQKIWKSKDEVELGIMTPEMMVCYSLQECQRIIFYT